MIIVHHFQCASSVCLVNKVLDIVGEGYESPDRSTSLTPSTGEQILLVSLRLTDSIMKGVTMQLYEKDQLRSVMHGVSELVYQVACEDSLERVGIASITPKIKYTCTNRGTAQEILPGICKAIGWSLAGVCLLSEFCQKKEHAWQVFAYSSGPCLQNSYNDFQIGGVAIK